MLLIAFLSYLCRACRVVRAFGAEESPVLKKLPLRPHDRGRDALPTVRVSCLPYLTLLIRPTLRFI